MRVLHVTRDFPPPGNGGLSTAVGGMVRASCAAGLTCAVVSFDGYRPRARPAGAAPARREEHGGVEVLRLSSPGHLERAHDLAAGFGPDRIHVHHEMLWDFAAEVRARTAAPALITTHTVQAEQSRLRGLSHETMSLASQRLALRDADLILAPSDAAAACVREHHPEVGQRLRVARLGLDDDRLAAATVRDRSHPTALFAGRFADINGFGDLLRALPGIAARVPEARFVVAGGLPENRRSEARWRDRFSEAAGAETIARTRFTGWLDPTALAAEYAAAGVLLAPSWFETFAQVVLEGMAHGLGIAASSTPAIAELVEHQRSALLSAPRDVAGFRDDAVRLLTDPDLSGRLGEVARADAGQRTWPRMIGELLQAYEYF